MKPLVLMNPGPINVTERVRRALLIGDMCHREAEYYDIQDEVRSLLLKVMGLDSEEYSAILLTGSGTAAMEAVVSSAMGAGEKLLVINNGVYGDRLAQMARAHGIPVVELVYAWTERPDLRQVASALDGDPTIRALAVVHHETTTGMINPLSSVAAIARERGVQLLVDSVSGLAGEEFSFAELDPTYVMCTANKCFQGLPGISFVFAKRRAVQRAGSFPVRSVYLNLPSAMAKQERRDTAFTMAVQVLAALREALLELEEETVAGRIERYKEASRLLREGFTSLDLQLLLPPAVRSNTISTILLPQSVGYKQLHDGLKAEGFIIYGGQGDLSRSCFRIANMGEITREDLERCIVTLKKLIEP